MIHQYSGDDYKKDIEKKKNIRERRYEGSVKRGNLQVGGSI